jgi:hypothetical protein
MTCAGLLGLAVDHGLDQESRGSKSDDAIRKALKRLAQNVGERTRRAKPEPTEMYFLWSVERVAVLYQLSRIEGKDWYRWGMQVLLSYQNPEGGWSLGGVGANELSNTCFALLFLQRANLVQDLTDKLEEMEAALGLGQGKKK